MTIIGNHVIQADLIAQLKAHAALTAIITAAEVREDQYQGTSFNYPAVRVNLIEQSPIAEQDQCVHTNLLFSIRIFSEQASSKQCEQISSVVAEFFHKMHFFGTGWRSVLYVRSVDGALLVSERLWRGEVFVGGRVYPWSGR